MILLDYTEYIKNLNERKCKNFILDREAVLHLIDFVKNNFSKELQSVDYKGLYIIAERHHKRLEGEFKESEGDFLTEKRNACLSKLQRKSVARARSCKVCSAGFPEEINQAAEVILAYHLRYMRKMTSKEVKRLVLSDAKYSQNKFLEVIAEDFFLWNYVELRYKKEPRY